MSYDKLKVNLIDHERSSMKEKIETVKKGKIIALNNSKNQNEEESREEDELAIISKRLNGFLKRRSQKQ